MLTQIHLLGRPMVERHGTAIPPPKGRKAWGLLAFLASTERPCSRAELASLLFANADDPLSALRWNLLQLRRLLGSELLPTGEKITLALPSDAYVDVRVLRRGSWVEATRVTGLGSDLLEGMDFPSAPAFEAWLLNERRHLDSMAVAVLREAVMFKLAAGDSAAATDLALQLVSLDPMNETSQSLLIRAYVECGDRATAEVQLQACRELFRKELGIEPGLLVTSAVERIPFSPASVHVQGESSVRALLEAGEAATRAGAFDHGVRSLQAAVAAAVASGNLDLEARSRYLLGSTLMHSGRNRYEEAAISMHLVARLAERLGDRTLQASAYRELAWAELLAARYLRVETHLDRAAALAGDDAVEQAAILFVRGMGLTETGKYDAAITHLKASVELARRTDDFQRVGLSLSMLGKAHLLRREMVEARAAFSAALQVFRSHNWTTLVPWAETYLAELEFIEGHVDLAGELYEHAFTLASQIEDPCFRSKSEVGIGLVQAARGNSDIAMERLESARMWLVQTPDHTWTMACALDALCSVAIENKVADGRGWVAELEDLAGRTGMRELLVHAYLHRHALGDHSAVQTAMLLAREVENPHLHDTIAAIDRGEPRRIPA